MPSGLVVRKGGRGNPGCKVVDASTGEVLGEVLFPTRGKHAGATVVVDGNRFDVFLQGLVLKEGDKTLISAAKAKGGQVRLTVNYRGKLQYVADCTPKGWILRLGVMKMGRFSCRRLQFADCVPKVLQLYLLWYVLETQPATMFQRMLAKIARCCGLT